MADYKTIEDFVYGPGGDRKIGAVTACEEAIRLATAQKLASIQVEIRKQPIGESSGQEGVEHVQASADVETFARAICTRLQSSPGDAFRGILRLNFREAGKSSNHLTSFERTMQGNGGGVAQGDGTGAHVPYTVYAAALEDNRRQSDANVRMVNGVVNVIEKVGSFIGSLIPQGAPQAAPGKDRTDLIFKTLGVLAQGQSNPGGAAAAAGAIIQEELSMQALPSGGGGGGGASSSASPSPSSSPSSSAPSSSSSAPFDPTTMSEADAERWARANPDAAKRMGMKLYSEGL